MNDTERRAQRPHETAKEHEKRLARWKRIGIFQTTIATPQEMLRHHVTGAIERGEAVAIVEKPIFSIPDPTAESYCIVTRPISASDYAARRATAELLATSHNEAVLAMARRIAMEREGHYLNKGHLKP